MCISMSKFTKQIKLIDFIEKTYSNHVYVYESYHVEMKNSFKYSVYKAKNIILFICICLFNFCLNRIIKYIKDWFREKSKLCI